MIDIKSRETFLQKTYSQDLKNTVAFLLDTIKEDKKINDCSFWDYKTYTVNIENFWMRWWLIEGLDLLKWKKFNVILSYSTSENYPKKCPIVLDKEKLEQVNLFINEIDKIPYIIKVFFDYDKEENQVIVHELYSLYKKDYKVFFENIIKFIIIHINNSIDALPYMSGNECNIKDRLLNREENEIDSLLKRIENNPQTLTDLFKSFFRPTKYKNRKTNFFISINNDNNSITLWENLLNKDTIKTLIKQNSRNNTINSLAILFCIIVSYNKLFLSILSKEEPQKWEKLLKIKKTIIVDQFEKWLPFREKLVQKKWKDPNKDNLLDKNYISGANSLLKDNWIPIKIRVKHNFLILKYI